MSREISRAESWERVYEAFQQINFTAFDYETVKASLVEYIKIYHPESFNDYIESSEFIAILELFSYIAELLAYRIDVNAHENFMSTAQRKKSILRLATLLSYNPTRNIPARALVKMETVKTTEAVYDSRGINLANRKIIWNDPNNTDWKEHFFLVINKLLQQDFGTVLPSDRVQVDDVLFELYALDNQSLENGILSYNVTADGSSLPMELVPVTLSSSGPQERRPGTGSTFTILYGSDGLGDSSDTTGFFMYTKQGSLKKVNKTFDGITPNQTAEFTGTKNINDTDVWVNQINPETGAILDNINFDEIGRNLGSQGLWTKLTEQGVENIVFNTDLNRNKYQIETLEDDEIRLIFGDGEFTDIPNGSFDVWMRTSANANTVIERSAIRNISGVFSYIDSISKAQTFTFTISAINTITNASASETIERIKQTASSVYSTQDRMVNHKDYNVYPLQDPSILRLRAVNRTFAGQSKYLAWHDPSEYYEDVKIFGNDLVLLYRTDNINESIPNGTDAELVIREYLQPLLSDPQLMTYHAVNGVPLPARQFTATEVTRIENAFALAVINNAQPVSLVYQILTGSYTWVPYPDDNSLPTNAVVTFTMELQDDEWTVTYNATRAIVESPTTKFWHHNDLTSVISSDTLNSNLDIISILQANVSGNRDCVLSADINSLVAGAEVDDVSPNIGQPVINQLYVVPPDSNGDGIPDDLLLDELLDQNETQAAAGTGNYTLADFSYLTDVDNLEVYAYDVSGVLIQQLEKYVDYTEVVLGSPGGNLTDAGVAATFGGISSQTVNILAVPAGTVTFEFRKLDYVYYIRTTTTTNDIFTYSGSSDANALSWYTDINKDNEDIGDNVRYRGRDNLNFGWYHRTPRGHLIDPSTTNINDMFVVTRGYYTALVDFLDGKGEEPTLPTPLQLRNDYAYLIDAKMISDTVVLHPGQFKILFGPSAPSELQAKFVVVRKSTSTKTDNEIKVSIVDTIKSFFNVEYWEYGETFNFTELGSQIHGNLLNDISSVVLVPTKTENQFGDLFQVTPQENELFVPSISVDDIDIVEFLNPRNIRQ